MKKHFKIFLICLTLISIIMSTSSFAKNEIKVSIDGEYVNFDVEPQLINDRTMVPLRAIFEELGASVSWDDTTQTVTAVKDDITVKATIGNTHMYINGKRKVMDTAPMLLSGRTLVPVRFVAEAFECNVDWDEENNMVVIKNQENDDIILPMDVYNNLTEEEIYEMNS